MKSFIAAGQATSLGPTPEGSPQHGPPPLARRSHPQLGPKPWVPHADGGVTVPIFPPAGPTGSQWKHLRVLVN